MQLYECTSSQTQKIKRGEYEDMTLKEKEYHEGEYKGKKVI